MKTINCGALTLDLSALDEPDPPGQSWRDRFPVHPCADVFPMLPDADLNALAADIKTNGQRQAVVLTRVNGRLHVLDGRNRLEAMERAGLARQVQTATLTVADPAAYVISANIRRRHLTKAQQAELIVRAHEASRTGVLNLRKPVNGRINGQIKDPIIQRQYADAKKQGISKGTLNRARAKVQGKSSNKKNASRQTQWQQELRAALTHARTIASLPHIRQFVLRILDAQ
jgi:hypothetical protein